jgi:hypothetical protein
MTPLGAVILTALGTVFALWAFLMFRALFQARRFAVANSGKTWPGPLAVLPAWRDWARSRPPDFKRLMAITAMLFLIVGLSAIFAPIRP